MLPMSLPKLRANIEKNPLTQNGQKQSVNLHAFLKKKSRFGNRQSGEPNPFARPGRKMAGDDLLAEVENDDGYEQEEAPAVRIPPPISTSPAFGSIPF